MNLVRCVGLLQVVPSRPRNRKALKALPFRDATTDPFGKRQELEGSERIVPLVASLARGTLRGAGTMVQPYAGFGLDCVKQENGMELAQEKSTPQAITVARHVVGMAVVSLANPLIYYDSNPVEAWAITLFGAIIIASILFGLLALIQPQRVKLMFPMTPIKSAWFILALMLLSNWQGYRSESANHQEAAPTSQQAQPRYYTDEEVGFSPKR